MIRFATIGMDNSARTFLEAAAQSRRLRYACGCPAPDSRLSHEAQIYEALLSAGQQIDAVYISGSVSSRFQLARRLLDSRRHVMCGNLAAAGPKTLDSLIRCARRNNVCLTEALPQEYISGLAGIRVHMARLGAVRQVRFQFCSFQGQSSESSHPGLACIRPLTELFGMPKRITAEAMIPGNGQEGAYTILARYSNDLTAELLCSGISGCRISNCILGEYGELRFKDLTAPHQFVLCRPDGGREALPSVSTGYSAPEEWVCHMEGSSGWLASIQAVRCAAAAMDMTCAMPQAVC